MSYYKHYSRQADTGTDRTHSRTEPTYVRTVQNRKQSQNKLLIFTRIGTESHLAFRIFFQNPWWKKTPFLVIEVNFLSPATAPDDKVAIIGVFVLELIWARHLKSNPSSAIA